MMAKKHSIKSSDKSRQLTKSTAKPLIQEKYQDLFYIGMIFLAVFVFFSSAIFGNGFNVSDNLASTSLETYVNNANSDGNFPQWIPYIFGGMPSFAAMLTTGTRLWAFIQTFFFTAMGLIGWLFANDVARLAFYYVVYGTGMYILMRTKEHERFVAFFTSIAAVFSTCVIVWIMIGHNTKPVVFAIFPYVLLLLEKLRQKFSLFYTSLLIIAIHLMLEAGHVQMIFYGMITFALYLLLEFISRLIAKREPIKVLRAAGLFLVAVGLAFSMSSDRYLSTLEYTPHSTRGSGPILKSENTKIDADGGNDYDYATMWSYSPEEVMLFFVPNYFGFGKLDYKGPATRGESIKLPTYWGQKPFDDAAAYMGIAVLGLAILGFILYRQNVFVQFLFVLTLFSLFLSFGKNFSLVFDVFYYYFPSFSKFRAPSMALAIMQFAVPILAGYGLSGIIKWRKSMKSNDERLLKLGMFAAGGFLAIGFLFSIVMKNTYINAVAESSNRNFQNYSRQISDFTQFVYSQMISDWIITGLIAVVSAIFIYLFVKQKINKPIFYIAIITLLISDLWRVDFRSMEVSDKVIKENVFKKTDLISYLKQDNSIYRVADLSQRESPNALAYFEIENVNGYHSAKLRIYQDLMDVANLPQAQGSTSMVFNPFLWNLLNVKYILSQKPFAEGMQPVFQSQQTGELLYINSGMLPRAFFVDSIIVEEPLTILNHLRDGDFEPRRIAYIEEALPKKIEPAEANTSAKVIEHKNQFIKIQAHASGNNLLFISEIFYPASWKAYIDGKETQIFKTNYAFRSIIVPKGKHDIELRYESSGFETGKTLSLASNILVALLLLGGIYIKVKSKKES